MRLWFRFARDRRGISAVEFALIAPIMLVLYAGLVELCQAMLAERRTSHVASAVGDLVAQSETITAADVTDIFDIGRTVMKPFPVAQLKQRVTSVVADAENKPRVEWSQGSGLTAKTKAALVTLPGEGASAMSLSSGESVIMSETEYAYTSPIKYLIPSAVTYTETFYLRPRRSDKVVCADC